MSKNDKANTIVKGWTRLWSKSDLKWANNVNSGGSPQVQQDKGYRNTKILLLNIDQIDYTKRDNVIKAIKDFFYSVI